MLTPEHHYEVTVRWQGNRGTGTSGYRDYGREHTVTSEGKHAIDGSSDRVFHGDAERWNPEELLLAALAQCHMLSYLHVATAHGIVVEAYVDDASGTMRTTPDGAGAFTEVVLHPRIAISAGDPDLAARLHHDASAKCFIANSVNFPVRHVPEIRVS